MQVRIWSAGLAEDRIVAVGLLTQREVELLGNGFSRLWPVDQTPCFTDLIKAIDEADEDLRQAHELNAGGPGLRTGQ